MTYVSSTEYGQQSHRAELSLNLSLDRSTNEIPPRRVPAGAAPAQGRAKFKKSLAAARFVALDSARPPRSQRTEGPAPMSDRNGFRRNPLLY